MKATVWRATLVFFLVVSAILGMSTLGASQTITDLEVLGPGPYSWAWGVNLQGQAVGYSWAGSTGPIYPVRWERNGAITALDNVGGNALAINNLGEAVGYQSPGYNRGERHIRLAGRHYQPGGYGSRG